MVRKTVQIHNGAHHHISTLLVPLCLRVVLIYVHVHCSYHHTCMYLQYSHVQCMREVE